MLNQIYPGIMLKGLTLYSRWKAGLHSRSVKVDGVKWSYLKGGRGDRILFLHGFGLSKDQWGRRLPLSLISSYELMIPDLPGFGSSTKNLNLDYGIKAQADRLHRFLQTLKIDSFHLIGHSMGGSIAAYFTARYPEKIKSLLLMGPFGIQTEEVSEGLRMFQENPGSGLFFKTEDEFDRIMKLVYNRPAEIPPIIKKYVIRQFGEKNYELHKKIFHQLFEEGLDFLHPYLKRISVPVMVVWGEDDRIFLKESADILHRAIPHSRVLILEKCGHNVSRECPYKFISDYQDFLRKISAKVIPRNW